MNKSFSETEPWSSLFTYLTSLRHLEIKAKVLDTLTKDTFKNLLVVESIKMNSCSVSEIDPDAFVNLENLKLLDLSQNKLLQCTFKIPDSLENLNLSNNQIKVKQGVFSASNVALRKLIQLDLSNNDIKSLPAGCFSGLVSLKYLSLAKNELNNVSEHAFEGLVNLRHLDLSRTEIRKIRSGLFSATNYLKRLDLRYNSIELVEEDAFSKFRTIPDVLLNENEHHYLFDSFLNRKLINLMFCDKDFN
jgi:Leucine-rich repeat (LRR) protein